MNEEKETGRLEAFSDGVFAVAITLLVLDIKVPALPAVGASFSLAKALIAEWPAYLSYLISFLTILIMWVNHHRIFGLIKRSDDGFLLLNGLLLLCICLIPFSTSLLAAYILHAEAGVAVKVYAVINFFMALVFNRLWRYASHGGRLLAQDHDPILAAGITRSYRFGPLVYLMVFGLAFVSAIAAFLLSLLLAIYFTIPPRKHIATSPN